MGGIPKSIPIPIPHVNVVILYSCFVYQVWQRTKDSHLVMVIVFLLEVIQSSVSLGWFDTASLGTKLLVVDISLDRAFTFIENIWFMTSLNITSYSDKKQRRLVVNYVKQS